MAESFARTWKEIAIGFLQVGATAYGGPATFAGPGFIVMLGLTMVYAAYGVSPILRGALYGLGPVVLVAIFFAALFRLRTSALRSRIQAFMAGVILIGWRIAPLKAMLGGSVFGILRDRMAIWAR